jgi:hypothetical protein
MVLPAVLAASILLSCGETVPVRNNTIPETPARDAKAFSVLCTGDLLYNDLVPELIRCSDPKYPFAKIEQEL